MHMPEQYLKTLIQSMEEKKAVLKDILDGTDKQRSALEAEEPDWEEFDRMLDEKGKLIEELIKLDDGFNAVFDRIKDDLVSNKEKYRNEIATLQDQIRYVTEQSNAIQAAESRNSALVKIKLGESRKKIKQTKVSVQAASRYYTAMNRINLVDPQLMDKKK